EGGVIPSLTAAATARWYRRGQEVEAMPLAPDEVEISSGERAPPAPEGVEGAAALARSAAAAGLAALRGEPGPTRDALVHAGSAVLVQVGAAATRREAAAQIRRALDSGEARRRLLAR